MLVQATMSHSTEGLRIGVARIIRHVEQTAAGRFGIKSKLPALAREVRVVQCARRPERRVLHGIDGQCTGEGLVEVSAGDDIVTRLVLLSKELRQHLGLCGLALTVVICLKMEID